MRKSVCDLVHCGRPVRPVSLLRFMLPPKVYAPWFLEGYAPGGPSRIVFVDREFFFGFPTGNQRGEELAFPSPASGLSFRSKVFRPPAQSALPYRERRRTPGHATSRGVQLRSACQVCDPGHRGQLPSARRRGDVRPFECAGLYYAATAREGRLCAGLDRGSGWRGEIPQDRRPCFLSEGAKEKCSW